MNYRSRFTQQAFQYKGEPIEGITCEGTPEQRLVRSCDNTRGHLPHVHTKETGGLTVLRFNDWIIPVPAGPFHVISDNQFRAQFEVPDEEPEPEPIELAAHAMGVGADIYDPDAQVAPDPPEAVLAGRKR